VNESGFLHMVYFYPADGADTEETEQLIAGIRRNLPGIPGVLRLEVGTPAGTPREVVDNGYAVAMLCEFADADAQDAYQDHPDHHRFVEECRSLWSKVIVFDSLIRR
jgi:quinol monooxygenase YgiN